MKKSPRHRQLQKALCFNSAVRTIHGILFLVSLIFPIPLEVKIKSCKHCVPAGVGKGGGEKGITLWPPRYPQMKCRSCTEEFKCCSFYTNILQTAKFRSLALKEWQAHGTHVRW